MPGVLAGAGYGVVTPRPPLGLLAFVRAEQWAVTTERVVGYAGLPHSETLDGLREAARLGCVRQLSSNLLAGGPVEHHEFAEYYRPMIEMLAKQIGNFSRNPAVPRRHRLDRQPHPNGRRQTAGRPSSTVPGEVPGPPMARSRRSPRGPQRLRRTRRPRRSQPGCSSGLSWGCSAR